MDLFGNNFPYRFYLMPNVGKHGYLYFVATHAFFDAISIVSSWQAMTVEKDFSGFKNVAEPTLPQKVFNYASAPIGMLRVIL